MTIFLKHISSAVSTHLPSFASEVGKPLNPHISGSSTLIEGSTNHYWNYNRWRLNTANYTMNKLTTITSSGMEHVYNTTSSWRSMWIWFLSFHAHFMVKKGTYCSFPKIYATNVHWFSCWCCSNNGWRSDRIFYIKDHSKIKVHSSFPLPRPHRT